MAWFAGEGDQLYFSPNVKNPVQIPEYHSPKWDPEDLKPEFFGRPQWYRGIDYAWIPMVPRFVDISQHGSIFEVFKDYDIPTSADRVVVDGSDRYMIPYNIQQRWKAFEYGASIVIGTLFEHSNLRSTQVLCVPPPDALGGYTRLHKSAYIAIRQAYRSRSWFNVLTGTLLYVCMRASRLRPTRGGQEIFDSTKDILSASMAPEHAKDTVDPVEFLPVWFVRVAGIHPELVPFLSMLRVSFSAALSYVTYTGMFIRIKDMHESGLAGLSFFIINRVPIFYPWGTDEENHVKDHPHLACYRPPISLVRAALARKQQAERAAQPGENETSSMSDMQIDTNYAFYSDFSLGTPPEYDHEIDRPPTPSSIHSGHNPDFFTMQEFFQKRGVINAGRRERETMDGRLQREAKVQTRNSTIYYWRENSNACMIRLRISSRYRALLEDKESGYQWRYDPFTDEVDYARTFDPKPEDLMCSTDKFDSVELSRLDRQMRDGRRKRIPELQGRERIEPDWSADSALDVASFRFGFTRTKDAAVRCQSEANDMWHKVRTYLQFRQFTTGPCPSDIQPFVSTLLTFLEGFRPDEREEGELEQDEQLHPVHPYAELWDAHPFNNTLSHSTAVRELRRLGPKHVLVGQAEGCSWSLVVLTDVDALHACRLREAGLSVKDVAWHFLDRGIPCRTMVQTTTQLNSQHSDRPAIELRFGGYSFQESDYRSYRRLVRNMLSRPGVAFAAFKYGGIVWRIAREEYGKLDEGTLSAGPDFTSGTGFTGDVRGWVDNELSEADVALLCGVYLVISGEDLLRVLYYARANKLSIM